MNQDNKETNDSNKDTARVKNSKNTRFDNTERDEGTLGVSKDRDVDPGLADGDQPQWQPPESIPEPRPADPIMKPN